MSDPVATTGKHDETTITDWLPHRPPALLVDHLHQWEPFSYAQGSVHLSAAHPCFAGHFPGHPIAPGVVIVEALAQLGALLWNLSHTTPGQLVLFAGIDNWRFRKPVTPGDTVTLKVAGLRVKSGYGKAQAIAHVNDTLICSGDLSLFIPRV